MVPGLWLIVMGILVRRKPTRKRRLAYTREMKRWWSTHLFRECSTTRALVTHVDRPVAFLVFTSMRALRVVRIEVRVAEGIDAHTVPAWNVRVIAWLGALTLEQRMVAQVEESDCFIGDVNDFVIIPVGLVIPPCCDEDVTFHSAVHVNGVAGYWCFECGSHNNPFR